MTWLIIWLSVGVVTLCFEGYAIASKVVGDTLSEQVWKWLKVVPGVSTPKQALISWRSFVVGAGLIWLFGHFLFGWWT